MTLESMSERAAERAVTLMPIPEKVAAGSHDLRLGWAMGRLDALAAITASKERTAYEMALMARCETDGCAFIPGHLGAHSRSEATAEVVIAFASEVRNNAIGPAKARRPQPFGWDEWVLATAWRHGLYWRDDR